MLLLNDVGFINEICEKLNEESFVDAENRGTWNLEGLELLLGLIS